MPCCFKPTVDMNLTFEETQVCAYVFNPNLDPRYVADTILILVHKFSFIYINGYYLLGIPLKSKCLFFFYFNFCNSGIEILYRVGNNLGTRQTFQSLCPNKPVREEVYGSFQTMHFEIHAIKYWQHSKLLNLFFNALQIILFMCLKVAYSQLYRTRSVWCMPPAFAVYHSLYGYWIQYKNE